MKHSYQQVGQTEMAIFKFLDSVSICFLLVKTEAQPYYSTLHVSQANCELNFCITYSEGICVPAISKLHL